VVDIADGTATLKRLIEGGLETVEARLPLLMTVPAEANEPRPQSAKRIMRFKKAKCPWELLNELDPKKELTEEELEGRLKEKEYALGQAGLLIAEWDGAAVAADMEQCGYVGSPTRVMKVESAVLKQTEHKRVEPTEAGLRELVEELARDHIIE